MMLLAPHITDFAVCTEALYLTPSGHHSCNSMPPL